MERLYTEILLLLDSIWNPEALQIIRDLAVIIASIVTILGISAWKREFKGKKDMELAEDVLCLFYRAERAIEAIRFPLYDLAQGQSREPEKDETPEKKQARDRAYVVFKKIMENGDIFDDLYKMRFRFITRFGKEKARPFDEIKRIVNTIWVYTQQLAELWEKQFKGRKLSKHDQEFMNECQSVIWQGWGEDKIEPKLRDIVKSIEDTCRPIIEGSHPTFF